MASVCSDPNGRKRIMFFDQNGQRKALRLGKMARDQADVVRGHIEKIITGKITGGGVPDQTAHWLASRDDLMAGKLADVGLIPRRESQLLGLFLRKYIESRTDLKPRSILKLEQTEAKLLAFFDEKIPLREITPDQASDWRNSLLENGLSEAAAKIHAGNVKTIFRNATDRGLLTKNPFAHLISGVTAAKNERFVSGEEADKILEACPDLRWRVIFALNRYAGLRFPSEVNPLTWRDVDWERARLTVKSPKTERFEGHEQRVVPIVPKLMDLLRQAFDAAPEGQTYIVRIASSGYAHVQLREIIRQAGIEPWDDLFQTLRRSCEIECVQPPS